jgi:AraC family ethanolamine operon transcriptional activator
VIPQVKLEPGADLDPLVEALRGWDLELNPLGPARSPSSVSAVAGESLVAMRVEIGAATRQTGAPPSGLRTFGLPEGNAEVTRWCGHPVGLGHLSVFDPAGDFRATARAGFAVQICSISEERLAAACAELGLPEPDRLLGRTARVFDCPADALETLRVGLRQLSGVLEAPNPGVLDHAATEIASRLVQAAAAGRELRLRIDPRRSERVLDEALAAIDHKPRAAHSVRALCGRTGASERTLRHAFQRRFGVPPVTYLRSLRLNGARRDLWDADPSLETVTRVAQRWNFRNAGDFAAHYARLFGERPSETLRRSARR